MAPWGDTQTPRRPTSTRLRLSARSKSVSTSHSLEKESAADSLSEPPRKRRKYIPGGPGGGGRFIDEGGNEVASSSIEQGSQVHMGLRGRSSRENVARNSSQEVFGARERPVRQTRTVAPRPEQTQMRFTSAAHAAAVVQSDGFKPREERAWEEFHPEMDIDMSLRAFSTNDIEGVIESLIESPVHVRQDLELDTTKTDRDDLAMDGDGVPTPAASVNGENSMTISIPGTPGGGRRRPGRPPKDPVAFFTAKAAKLGKELTVATVDATPKTPRTLPLISNINAKEKLTLPLPSYRKTDTLARFDDKSLGLVRYVDKSMANVGYQESDQFQRPEHNLIKAFDANADDDLDINTGYQSDGAVVTTIVGGGVGRVEYDMDEQDDKWLQAYNKDRKSHDFEPITREIFEITMTKIEKEWHLLEKRIPKPNPKPPQTQRPRSSSAAAVNGEPQLSEELDSRCAICDDGDCENTNAIVFCDGCDSAVHQECYGVPFIPEGQWLCRKCQLIGRGVPTCIFCPNTDGAFKQTNASKWAHLLCAMWIPEVSLGNHTFMEPVMDAERVPKNRWKLVCYICEQKMGACIQCADKHCYEAFHPTCARRAGLYLKMKNDHGTLAFLDGSTEMEAKCHRHVPADHEKEHNTVQATKDAIQFYKKTMKGRLWASSQASASAMAASHRHAFTDHHPDDSQLTGARISLVLQDGKRRGDQTQKNVWKLPSGAPVIPQVVFNNVERSLQRFSIHKRKEYSADACRYWTLKREARRGAALLKRLQLQMETFSSMELTRRNWVGMGTVGRSRLARRIQFAETLIKDLEKLKHLSADILAREIEKLQAAQYEEELVENLYFPVARFFLPIVEKSITLDSKGVFTKDLNLLKTKIEERQLTTVNSFVLEFSAAFKNSLMSIISADSSVALSHWQTASPMKKSTNDFKECKRLAKRIFKTVQPQVESAARVESEVANRPLDELLQNAEQILEKCLDIDALLLQRADAHTKTMVDRPEDKVELTEPLYNADDSELSTVDRDVTNDASDSIEVEMPDVDDCGQIIDEESTVIVAEPASSVGSPLSAVVEYDDDMTAAESLDHDSLPPADQLLKVNKYMPNGVQITPPTPPFSTNETSDVVDVLVAGGVPWYLKDFEPDGTSLVHDTAVLADGIEDTASVVEDQEAEEDDHASIVAATSPVTKKAKPRPKKKARARR